MSLSLLIAWRYLRRPTDRLISAVGLVSILGLVIGVMALVISMALMTGYREDLQEKLLGGNAEVFIYAIDGNIDATADTVRRLEAEPAVADAAPVLFQYSLISSEAVTTGEQVMLKGIEPERGAHAPMLARILGATRLRTTDGTPGVAVGKFLAQKMKLSVGSAVTITVPRQQAGSILPRSDVFIVTNVFETGFHEFDTKWIFMPLDEAQRLLEAGGGANLIEVDLKNGVDIGQAVRRIDEVTGKRYAVNDWRQMNKQLFSLLQIQQLVLFIVIGLIVFVSTFNIVSTLIMTVHEKRREIGILTAMGAEGKLLRRVFIWYGTLVGVIGTGVGVTLAVAICLIITKYELVSFGPEIAEVYFVSSIPFVVRVRDLAAIIGFATIVSWLATIIPSARAMRLQVADALRQ